MIVITLEKHEYLSDELLLQEMISDMEKSETLILIQAPSPLIQIEQSEQEMEQ